MSKRNTLCQHINNVLCFFASHDPITKLKLLKAYCNSFYGSVLWDLTMTNASIRDVCIAWRKGLRCIWDLPHNTHCNLLPLLCDMLPLMDELSCRCATFITNVLDSVVTVSKCFLSVGFGRFCRKNLGFRFVLGFHDKHVVNFFMTRVIWHDFHHH